MTSNDAGNRRPWYREPFMWLVVGIPLLTVVAGLSTVLIAHRHSDTIVSDEFRKEGLAIQHDPTRDLAAARVGAHAAVNVTTESLVVRLEVAQGAAPRGLVAVLSHATRAELDRLIALSPAADGSYQAHFAPLEAGHWYLEVSPTDRSWRLRSDFSTLPAQFEMSPARNP
jgi:uncharacterized protein